jgi:hypothetical protein
MQQRQPTGTADLTPLPADLDHPIRSWTIAPSAAQSLRAIGTIHHPSRGRRAVGDDTRSGRSSDSSLASDG